MQRECTNFGIKGLGDLTMRSCRLGLHHHAAIWLMHLTWRHHSPQRRAACCVQLQLLLQVAVLLAQQLHLAAQQRDLRLLRVHLCAQVGDDSFPCANCNRSSGLSLGQLRRQGGVEWYGGKYWYATTPGWRLIPTRLDDGPVVDVFGTSRVAESAQCLLHLRWMGDCERVGGVRGCWSYGPRI